MIKRIPVGQSDQPIFAPLPTIPQSGPTLAKEAKGLSNREKGYAADEKYLGEQQRIDELPITLDNPWRYR